MEVQNNWVIMRAHLYPPLSTYLVNVAWKLTVILVQLFKVNNQNEISFSDAQMNQNAMLLISDQLTSETALAYSENYRFYVYAS